MKKQIRTIASIAATLCALVSSTGATSFREDMSNFEKNIPEWSHPYLHFIIPAASSYGVSVGTESLFPKIPVWCPILIGTTIGFGEGFGKEYLDHSMGYTFDSEKVGYSILGTLTSVAIFYIKEKNKKKNLDKEKISRLSLDCSSNSIKLVYRF